MASNKNSIAGNPRKAAVRAGLLAVSAAVAGLTGAISARADITGTKAFSNFSAANLNAAAQSTSTSLGYNSSGTSFELTNGSGAEAVSGFYSVPQTVSSFDVSFTLIASGSADGGAFIIDGASGATSYLGNAGGSGGYQGTAPNSIALEWEFYTGSEDGLAYNGGTPAYTYYTNVVDQGTTRPTINSGDQLQYNISYFGTTLTENVVDLTANRGLAKVYSNVNIPSVVGGSTAYVGFSGGTGSSTSTQIISNFTLVSNKTYSPISIASGFNEKGIVPVGGSLSSITATQDNGTAKGGDTWYEKGFDAAAPATGLPASGSTFVSQADSSHTFQMQSYASNDVVLITNNSSDGPASATITFTSQSQPYNALSFLTASGNGPNVLSLTVTYADGAPPTTGLKLLSPDWFSGSPSAWTANGRYSGTYDNVGSGNPNAYAEDVLLPDNTDPVSSVTISVVGGNNTPANGNTFIFAVSGEAGAAGPVITYTGATNNKWDTSTYNFNGTSGSIVEAVTFVTGDYVNFDDTAVGSHSVNIAVAGMNISGWNVSTSTGYTFTGYGLTGPGGLTLNGTGTVVLNNSNTFTGQTNIKNGLLELNAGSALASSQITVATGAGLNISSGAQLNGASLILSDSGTVNDFNSTLNVSQLAGTSAGVLNLNGTALTAGTVSFGGTIGGTSGSVTFTGGGGFTGTINDGSVSPISVTVNGSSGTTLVLSGSNTYTGGTTLLSGATEIGTPSSLGTGSVNLQGGSLGASAAQVNFANKLTGGSLIVAAGSNILEISGTNTFTGPVLIQSGATLQVDSPVAIGGINGANPTTGTITVASGGSLLVNDNSGTLGLTGGVLGGTPITAIISGSGAGGNGALEGSSSGATWAGNINVSGSATIAPGSASTLTLNGAITGTGSVLFASNSNDSGFSYVVINSPGTSNYTGPTQITGDYGTFGSLLVSLGANNALSTAAGLSFVTGGSGPATLDLARDTTRPLRICRA
jgi:autotransporter-associated beta strand protein